MNKENKKNTIGIQNFLWAVEANALGTESGRKAIFGNGRLLSDKNEEFRIDTGELTGKKGNSAESGENQS